MNLPRPPAGYDPQDQSQARRIIEREDGQNRKRGQDIELSGNERLIMTDKNTGDRVSITVESGVLVVTTL